MQIRPLRLWNVEQTIFIFDNINWKHFENHWRLVQERKRFLWYRDIFFTRGCMLRKWEYLKGLRVENGYCDCLYCFTFLVLSNKEWSHLRRWRATKFRLVLGPYFAFEQGGGTSVLVASSEGPQHLVTSSS
jgi:hypothetical protein